MRVSQQCTLFDADLVFAHCPNRPMEDVIVIDSESDSDGGRNFDNTEVQFVDASFEKVNLS